MSKLTMILIEIANTYLIYQIIPSFWIILFSVVFHAIFSKYIYNNVSNGKYSELVDKLSTDLLTNKKIDMTELNNFVNNYRFYNILGSSIIMILLYIMWFFIEKNG